MNESSSCRAYENEVNSLKGYLISKLKFVYIIFDRCIEHSAKKNNESLAKDLKN